MPMDIDRISIKTYKTAPSEARYEWDTATSSRTKTACGREANDVENASRMYSSESIVLQPPTWFNDKKSQSMMACGVVCFEQNSNRNTLKYLDLINVFYYHKKCEEVRTLAAWWAAYVLFKPLRCKSNENWTRWLMLKWRHSLMSMFRARRGPMQT